MDFLINKLNRTWSISHVDQNVLIAFTRRPTKAQTKFIQAYKFEPRQYTSNTIQMTIQSTKHIYKAHL